jgi:hypothetical protein
MNGLLSFLMLLSTSTPSEAAWSKPWKSGNVTVEKRPVVGSGLSEFRVTADSAVAPVELCDAAFALAGGDQKNPNVILTKVLSAQPDERVIYNQVRHAFISDRDYAMTVTRARAADGSCSVDFHITNEKAPPAPPGFFRMDRLRGKWIFESAAGRTRIVHTLFADPSGKIPPFLLEGEAQKIAENDIQLMLQKAHDRAAR